MKVNIAYKASVRNADTNGSVSKEVLEEIGNMEHMDANMSEHFKISPLGIIVSGGGIKFEYNKNEGSLYTVAIYDTNIKPNDEQLLTIVAESNDLIDLGFYGDDGWFVDVGDESFYIQLWDKNSSGKPVSVSVNE